RDLHGGVAPAAPHQPPRQRTRRDRRGDETGDQPPVDALVVRARLVGYRGGGRRRSWCGARRLRADVALALDATLGVDHVVANDVAVLVVLVDVGVLARVVVDVGALLAAGLAHRDAVAALLVGGVRAARPVAIGDLRSVRGLLDLLAVGTR